MTKPPPHIADHAAFAFEQTYKRAELHVRAADASADVLAYIAWCAGVHGCKLVSIPTRTSREAVRFVVAGGDADAWLEDCAVYIATAGEE